MNAITTSLANREDKLYEYNGRLSLIETCLCNMFTVVSTSDNSSSPVANAFPTELPTPADRSFPTEVFTPNEVHTPLSRRTAPTVATTSISPLLINLPKERATKVRKLDAGKDRYQYVRGCMDVVFSEEEMVCGNVGGKRQKERLDETRVDLVKRKLKNFCLFFVFRNKLSLINVFISVLLNFVRLLLIVISSSRFSIIYFKNC